MANHMRPAGTSLSGGGTKCYQLVEASNDASPNRRRNSEGTWPMIRPRRSLLFMPGSNARALEKARNLAADVLILDLEDSVAPDAKALARDQIAQAITAQGFGKREIWIRTNSLDTPWWADDVAMAGNARPDGILVPKVSTVEDLKAIGDRLADIGADPSIKVWAMIETARAVLDADKLAAASRDPETRLAGFVFGPNDISRETRIRMQPGRAAMIPMITHCILATRAHGLEILDGPYSDFSNVDGFAAGMRASARSRLRRQDADPSRPDRGLQCDLHAARRGSRARHARSSPPSSCRKTPRAAPSSSMAAWSSGCMPRWPSAPSRLPTRSRRWENEFLKCSSPLVREGRGKSHRLFAEFLRRPRMEAAGNGLLAAATLRRDVKARDAGVLDQRRKIRRLEKQFWLGMHGVK